MKPGDKVICVDDYFPSDWIEYWGLKYTPKKGNEYTIRDFHDVFDDPRGKIAVHLVECPNNMCKDNKGIPFEPWFFNWHFAVPIGNTIAMPLPRPIGFTPGKGMMA